MRILVISGPNAGGKSITLKTMGFTTNVSKRNFNSNAPKSKIFVFDQILNDMETTNP